MSSLPGERGSVSMEVLLQGFVSLRRKMSLYDIGSTTMILSSRIVIGSVFTYQISWAIIARLLFGGYAGTKSSLSGQCITSVVLLNQLAGDVAFEYARGRVGGVKGGWRVLPPDVCTTPGVLWVWVGGIGQEGLSARLWVCDWGVVLWVNWISVAWVHGHTGATGNAVFPFGDGLGVCVILWARSPLFAGGLGVLAVHGFVRGHSQFCMGHRDVSHWY
ncbi:hypothetical protein Tco_0570339 [Tanacetum coccineum]